MSPAPSLAASLGCAALLAAAGCRTAAPPGGVPAVVMQPDTGSRAALSRAVREALGGAPVLLADDALVTQSTLVVDRLPRRDETGLVVGGREFGRPERFDLLLTGSTCVLVREKTGERFALAGVSCAPLAAKR